MFSSPPTANSRKRPARRSRRFPRTSETALEIALPRISATTRLVSLPRYRLVSSVDGTAPRLPTAVRLGLRGEILSARFDCRHEGLTAARTRDNDELWREDVVELFLCTLEPPTEYFEFEANPLGAKFSARVSSPNLSRAGMTVELISPVSFSVKVARKERSWSATLNVSLREIFGGFPPPSLRGNLFRIDRQAGEFSALFPTLAEPPDFHLPGKFGAIRLAGSPAG